MTGQRPSTVLLANAMPEGGDCRLTDLLALTCYANERTQWFSPSIVVEEAGDLPIPPTELEIVLMRLWPQALQAVAYADDSYRHLIHSPSSATLRSAFLPVAPVLRAWHAELGQSEEEAAVQRWLDRLDWPLILRLAEERDAAARAICAGRACYDYTTRNIVALDA